MRFKSLPKILASLMVIAQNPAMAFTDFNRCSHVNADNTTFQGPSYYARQADVLRKWTSKCYPQWTDQVRANPYLIATLDDGGQQRRTAYPVFGMKKFTPDPNDPFELNGVTTYTNPANYYPPVPDRDQLPDDAAESVVDQAAIAMPCNLPEGYTIIGWCGAGCYAANQMVLFPEGYVEIEEAAKSELTHVVSLTQNSTLNNLEFQSMEMDGFTQDFKAKQQTLLKFKTESGGEIVVTKNHPLVDGKGKVRSAINLKVGNQLIKENGEKDAISSIEEVDYFGRVYNVTVKSSDRTENIVVAQGYLNGTFLYQNDYATFLNQKLLRDDLIPDEVIL